jgi:hypothetical protein
VKPYTVISLYLDDHFAYVNRLEAPTAYDAKLKAIDEQSAKPPRYKEGVAYEVIGVIEGHHQLEEGD